MAPRLTPKLLQLVHRHGDRTPITKLESQRGFWRGRLPSAAQLAAVAAASLVLLPFAHAREEAAAAFGAARGTRAV